jgi:hypothetical protein
VPRTTVTAIKLFCTSFFIKTILPVSLNQRDFPMPSYRGYPSNWTPKTIKLRLP